MSSEDKKNKNQDDVLLHPLFLNHVPSDADFEKNAGLGAVAALLGEDNDKILEDNDRTQEDSSQPLSSTTSPPKCSEYQNIVGTPLAQKDKEDDDGSYGCWRRKTLRTKSRSEPYQEKDPKIENEKDREKYEIGKTLVILNQLEL